MVWKRYYLWHDSDFLRRFLCRRALATDFAVFYKPLHGRAAGAAGVLQCQVVDVLQSRSALGILPSVLFLWRFCVAYHASWGFLTGWVATDTWRILRIFNTMVPLGIVSNIFGKCTDHPPLRVISHPKSKRATWTSTLLGGRWHLLVGVELFLPPDTRRWVAGCMIYSGTAVYWSCLLYTSRCV